MIFHSAAFLILAIEEGFSISFFMALNFAKILSIFLRPFLGVFNAGSERTLDFQKASFLAHCTAK